MRLSVVTLVIVMLTAGTAVAQERERGFVDLYGGGTQLFESDVPGWKFTDSQFTAGLRGGMWINDNVALTLRTWYFKTDLEDQLSSPGDLAFVGVSLELLMRWKLSDRWALYATLGPMMAVTTLDLDRAVKEDASSLAPGASSAVGVEVRVLSSLRAFAEMQGSLVYPAFELSDRTVTPRLMNMYGLVGLRMPF